MCVCVCALSCVQLFATPMDWNPPDSSVHGISQTKILEWVIISSSGSSRPRIEPEFPESPALAGRFFTTEPAGKPKCLEATGYCPKLFNEKPIICHLRFFKMAICDMPLSSEDHEQCSEKVHGLLGCASLPMSSCPIFARLTRGHFVHVEELAVCCPCVLFLFLTILKACQAEFCN